MRSIAHYFVLLFFSLLAWSCANQVAPTGGPKDTKAPEVTSLVPENHSVNFHAHEINITFNEYIQVKELSSQLVVSPPLKMVPETRVHKKTLTVTLLDTLLPNTTYSMNFGKAVGDLTEGNAIDTLTYVFSTGDILDTLEISGHIVNANDQKPEKEAKVLIYRDDADSVPFKKMPLYFARTDEGGVFHIKNISAGEYKLFAIRETNNNYLYDSPDEWIAFTAGKVQAGASDVDLVMFHELPKAHIQRVSSEEPGKVIVAMNRPIPDLRIALAGDTAGLGLDRLSMNAANDTVVIWYRNLLRDSLTVMAGLAGKMDTVTLRLQKTDSKFLKKQKFALLLNASAGPQLPVNLNEPIVINCSHPIMAFSGDNMKLMEDSLPVKFVSAGFSDDQHRFLVIQYPWKEGKNYSLTVPAQSMTDIFGLKNDTLQITFRAHNLIDYGSLKIKIGANNFPGENIFQLVNEKGDVARQISISHDTTLLLEYLIPGQYKVRMVEDLNKNKKEDTGNYLQDLQPERVIFYPESLTIRANWDVELTWQAAFSKR
jgi:hypothetical protein